jgi:hypothetical protein
MAGVCGVVVNKGLEAVAVCSWLSPPRSWRGVGGRRRLRREGRESHPKRFECLASFIYFLSRHRGSPLLMLFGFSSERCLIISRLYRLYSSSRNISLYP